MRLVVFVLSGVLISLVEAAVADEPVIDLWYGNTQEFGKQGRPQRWVNVLGNVSDPDGIETLTYSLNGQTPQPLSLGPDGRRLLLPGDFNVELDFNALAEGPNTLVLRAADALGNSVAESVEVTVYKGKRWPANYAAEWAAVGTLQEAAQVVDGLWKIEDNTIRPVQRGYDRLIAIGDMAWSNFEATVPVTIHGVSDFCLTNNCGGGAGVGLLVRWQGHYDWDGSQPRWGWNPVGALGWIRWGTQDLTTQRLVLAGSDGTTLAYDRNRPFAFGEPYVFKMRAQTLETGEREYSLKVWRRSEAEPQGWDLAGREADGTPLGEGSLLLVAHHVDAAFGRVTVRSLDDPDVDPPVVTEVEVNTGHQSALISWSTDEVSEGVLEYGTDDSYSLGRLDSLLLASAHSVELTGLKPATDYLYRISATDPFGNTATSAGHAFSTEVQPDVTPPAISGVEALPQTNWATITWITDEPASSLVEYGPDSAYGSAHREAALSTGHSVTIGPVAAGALYHYRVSSADAVGNNATTADLTFVTNIALPKDGTAPAPDSPEEDESDGLSGGGCTLASGSGGLFDPTLVLLCLLALGAVRRDKRLAGDC